MEQALIELLLNGGLHGALAVAVIVLWRENQRLHLLIERMLVRQQETHTEILQQSLTLERIEAQTNGKA